jgi:hypothetical protein
MPIEVADVQKACMEEHRLRFFRAVPAVAMNDDFVGLGDVDFREATGEFVDRNVQRARNADSRVLRFGAYVENTMVSMTAISQALDR